MKQAALKRLVRRVLRVVGLDVHYYVPPQYPVPLATLEQYGVDTIFDVGGHKGQTALEFRAIGFKGKIVSFEPVRALFDELQSHASLDPLWDAENVALGSTAGAAEINVGGGHSATSSLLPMTGLIGENEPDLVVQSTESVDVATLDAMMAHHYPVGDRCFLKLDVQGFERAVLEGGRGTIDHVVGIKMEMSLTPSYQGETLLPEMLPIVYGLGFRLLRFDNGWTSKATGELFQADGTFIRPERCLAPNQG